MNKKIIFELKLNSSDSIIAYEQENYETCYMDSMLCINIEGKKIKVVESSFCYGFGAEMYYRIHNVNDFDEKINFPDWLKSYFDNLKYDEGDTDNKSDNTYDRYCFANGNSENNLVLFLLKNKNGCTILLVKLWEMGRTKKWSAEVLNVFTISESLLAEWKISIKSEWERRAVIEGEQMAQANSRRKSTKEEWEQYFLFMRTDK